MCVASSCIVKVQLIVYIHIHIQTQAAAAAEADVEASDETRSCQLDFQFVHCQPGWVSDRASEKYKSQAGGGQIHGRMLSPLWALVV